MTAASLIFVVSERPQLSRELRAAVRAASGSIASRRVLQVPTGDRLLEALREIHGTPPAALIDLELGDEAVELVGTVSDVFPRVRLAVTGAADIPDDVRTAAIRAGRVEAIDSSFPQDRLAAWLEPAALEGGAAGRLICFLGAQDGAGASTSALHAAYAIATERGEKTLLVELDFHSGALAFRLRLDSPATWSKLASSDAPRADWEAAVSHWNGLDVIAAPQYGRELLNRGLPPVPAVLDAALRRYSLVVADLPAALSTSSRGVLARADRIYLVGTPELTSLHLARRRIHELRATGSSPEQIRFTLNRAASNRLLSEEDVVRIVGAPVSYSIPNDFSAVSAAEARGGLVRDDSELGRRLRGLGWNIADEPRPKPARRTALQWFFNG